MKAVLTLVLLASAFPALANQPSERCIQAAREWIYAGRFPEAFEAPDGMTPEECTGATDEVYARQDRVRAETARAAAEVESKRRAQAAAAAAKAAHELAAAEAAYQQKLLRERAAADAQARKPDVRLGMTSGQVISETRWGRPSKVTRSETAAGITEVWHYGWTGGSLTLRDGKVTAIYTSR